MHTRSRFAATAAFLVCTASFAAGQAAIDFPRFDKPAQVAAACEAGLAGAGRRLKALEKHPADTRWLAADDELQAYVEDRYGPVGLLSNVHPDPAVRDAAAACEVRWQGFTSSFGVNQKLFRALTALKPADAIDTEARRLALQGFEDAGMSLPAEKRPRAKQLSDRINELGLAFDKGVRDDPTKVAFTGDELQGVPRDAWKNAPRDAEGAAVLGLDTPSYIAVVTHARSPAVRERMYRAKLNEGGDGNLKVLAEIVQARKDYASLFGFASYDDFVLRRRMTGGTPQTLAFLDQVKSAVAEREKREIEELRAAKATDLGQPPAAVKLERWDVPYYTERARRERYSVDQEAFRPYFPAEQSVAFVMKVAEQLFGVRHTRIEGARLWHADASAWAVSDVASGKRIGTLLIDLYPRDGKYGHAAVWPMLSVATRSGRLPMAALVVNLDRNGLSLDEMETLLHEFGHALHNNLSRTRYTMQAGFSVLHDFAEAPSQMLEDWIYDPKVMAVMQEVCPACKPVPADLLVRALAARDYDKGLLFARQHLYASYDLALYGPEVADPQALWMRMEGATPLGHVQGTKMPAGFAHIAGSYGAGYYGYLYSLVTAMDLRTAFAADKLDPAVGRRYRNTVLAQGGERPPLELVKEFLGRETNANAFFDFLKR